MEAEDYDHQYTSIEKRDYFDNKVKMHHFNSVRRAPENLFSKTGDDQNIFYRENMASIAFTSIKNESYCNNVCKNMHQNNYNDYRFQKNPPEENTCYDLDNESSGRVPEKMIWPNEPETKMKNKREQILCGLQP